MAMFVSHASLLYLCALALRTEPAIPRAPHAIECRELPANIHASGELRQEIGTLLERSQTLRQQCAEIASAPRVRVVIVLTSGQIDAQTRARAVARRYASGLLTVVIQLPAGSGDFVELLAHELEHVRELIEGVNLPMLAQQGSRGVSRRGSDGAFETVRARAAGMAAAAETRPDLDPAAAAISRGVARAARTAWRFVRSVF